MVTVMLRCGNVVLPYAIVIYDKAVMSKIQIATDIINALPEPACEGYVLADSWYSCKLLFDASKSRGYTYQGKLNDLKEATVVLSWPKNALFNEKALRAFICPYTSMEVEILLNRYVHRWPIEIFFRESKRRLGLDDYQIRSERGIKRYFILLMLTYVY